MNTIDTRQLEPSGPPGPRTCGRCRAEFPGDPTLVGNGMQDWWACDPCRARLFPPAGSK
jgi:hypothetical protein